MFNLMETNFTCVGMGIVTKDKEEDSVFLEVHPVENMPSMEGDYNQPDKLNYQSTDASDNYTTFKIERSKTIRCRWLNLYNSNRASAPDAVIGEKVLLWQMAGEDIYYWTTLGIELRKREKAIYLWANKESSKPNEDNGEEAYYAMVDTRNKEIVVHTADNDGELTTYDATINTSEGLVTLEDGRGNYLQVDSAKDKYTLHMHKDYLAIVGINYDINTRYFSVNNPTNELIQLLMDWTDVDQRQMHLETIGSKTSVSAETISAYAKIKSRLATFKNGAGYISNNPKPIVKENAKRRDIEREDSFGYGRSVNLYLKKTGPFPDPSEWNTASQVGSDIHGPDYKQDPNNYSTLESVNNPGGMSLRFEGNMDVKAEQAITNVNKVDTKTKEMTTKADDVKFEAKEVNNKVSGNITNTIGGNTTNTITGNETNTISGRSDSNVKGFSLESNGHELMAKLVELVELCIKERHSYTYGTADGGSVGGTTTMTRESKEKFEKLKSELEAMM